MTIPPISCSHLKKSLILITTLLFSALGTACAAEPVMTKTGDLFVRDPYVVAVQESQTYYLYATHQDPETKRRGVQVYKSKDLESWSEGTVVFEIPDGIWADPTDSLWAPEVHLYNGKYYLFATLSNPTTTLTTDQKDRPDLYLRATSVFVSDSPDGPFTNLNTAPQTPDDWMSLGGTLWAEDGVAWMVFCHEWWQAVDGTFELMPMAPDLSQPLADPLTLFSASQGNWTRDMKKLAEAKGNEQPTGRVSDGPFVFKTKDDHLLMLWSSFGENGYACSFARSRSGKITGPWIPADEPMYDQDGGHGMIFETFDGRLILTLHAPNSPGNSRAQFLEIEALGDRIQLKQPEPEPEPEATSEPAPAPTPAPTAAKAPAADEPAPE